MHYVDHPENKFDGDIGGLERTHVYVDGLVYIGKEANNIDEQALDVQRSQVFIDEEKLKNKILALTPKEAQEIGIKYRSTLKKLKNNIELDNKFNLNTKAVRTLTDKILLNQY